MKLSIIILRLSSNHGANIRTNQGSLRRCHCTVNLLASVTMREGGCTPSLSNLRLTLKIQSIYYIECHMMYKYVYVFYCASINVVEIFRASYDVSDFTIGGNCPKETFGTIVRHIGICTETGSCANSAQMFLTFSVHCIFNCECLDTCLVKIHRVINVLSKWLNKFGL